MLRGRTSSLANLEAQRPPIYLRVRNHTVARERIGGLSAKARTVITTLQASPRDTPTSLSDLLAFESDRDSDSDVEQEQDPSVRAKEILDRAARALDAVRDVVGPDVPPPQYSSASGGPVGSTSGGPTGTSRPPLMRTYTPPSSVSNAAAARNGPGASTSGRKAGPSSNGSAGASTSGGPTSGGSTSGGPVEVRPESPGWQRMGASSSAAGPSWAEAFFSGKDPSLDEGMSGSGRGAGGGGGGSGGGGRGSRGGASSYTMQLQRQPAAGRPEPKVLDFAEAELPRDGFLQLRSQEAELTEAALRKELPPLQSILELTTAYRPPERSLGVVQAEAEVDAAPAPAVVGRQLADGVGELADGTRWEKRSGEDKGAGGYWKKWTLLRGLTSDGKVAWEECWWEASDWAGLKELGATKSGESGAGGAWRETWCEKAYHNPATLELTIERTAHKWARADGPNAEEWEEKWGEKHSALGSVSKWADKWGKEGANVWHEKWGEDYDGKGACTKWTDKWAERAVGYGAKEQWGDKWTEQFGAGKGTKHGEVWSMGAGGERYNRWWNEEHYGNGQVRRYGNSTSGEYWDATEWMDTYYNPIPHFGFDLAVRHSPGLWKVPVRPRTALDNPAGADESDEDTAALGAGLDALDAKRDDTKALSTGLDVLGGGSLDMFGSPGSSSRDGSPVSSSPPSAGTSSRDGTDMQPSDVLGGGSAETDASPSGRQYSGGFTTLEFGVPLSRPPSPNGSTGRPPSGTSQPPKQGQGSGQESSGAPAGGGAAAGTSGRVAGQRGAGVGAGGAGSNGAGSSAGQPRQSAAGGLSRAGGLAASPPTGAGGASSGANANQGQSSAGGRRPAAQPPQQSGPRQSMSDGVDSF